MDGGVEVPWGSLTLETLGKGSWAIGSDRACVHDPQSANRGQLRGEGIVGGSEVVKGGADVILICLGGPSAEQLDGVVLEAAAGGSGCRTDSERVA